MTGFYDRLAQTALNLIKDKGRSIEFINPATGVYDPSQGTLTPGAQKKKTVKAVFTSFELSKIDGTTIRADDKMCLISAKELGEEPNTASKIKEGATEWDVLSVDVVKPGSVALLYKVHVRR